MNRDVLEKILNEEDYEWLQEVIRKSFTKEKEKLKIIHLKKLQKLLEEKKRIEEDRKKIHERDQEEMQSKKIKVDVVDLTKDGIDPDVKKYLSLGPDFCESPTRAPYERMICETEKMCSYIRKESIEGKTKETR